MGARLGLLALHRRLKGLDIHGDATRTQRILREIQREAIGVIEPESRFAGEDLAITQLGHLAFEQRETTLQCVPETRLLERSVSVISVSARTSSG